MDDDLDPVLASALRLLEAVVTHGPPHDAAVAAHYHAALLRNQADAIGPEECAISPMVDFGRDGAVPRLLILGYQLVHRHHPVTPSLEASLFVPLVEARECLKTVYPHAPTTPKLLALLDSLY
jgi:hypothetical protein